MKIMFLDESGDHSLDKIDPSYPMFVLAGCIFDFDYYNSKAEKEVNLLKAKYFSITDVILRSYDIRKQKGDFAFLVDKSKREVFYEDINSLLKSLEFTIITAAINKVEFRNQYHQPDNPYHLCLRFILERSIMYLGNAEKMILRIESRETHNDRKLSEVYEEFRSQSHRFFKIDELQSKLIDLSFNQKTQNIAGMQIADLVAYPIGRWVIDNQRENKPFEVIKPKIHKKPGTTNFLNFGLKIFP